MGWDIEGFGGKWCYVAGLGEGGDGGYGGLRPLGLTAHIGPYWAIRGQYGPIWAWRPMGHEWPNMEEMGALRAQHLAVPTRLRRDAPSGAGSGTLICGLRPQRTHEMCVLYANQRLAKAGEIPGNWPKADIVVNMVEIGPEGPKFGGNGPVDGPNVP